MQPSAMKHALSHILLVCMCMVSSARQCFVIHGPSRVANSSAIFPCPEELYGAEPACGYSCARHKPTGEDLCSFYCFPAKHCRGGLVRPSFEMSPERFVEGCPKHVNYDPVEVTDFDCVAKCCTTDGCNQAGAVRTASHNVVLSALCLSLVAWLVKVQGVAPAASAT